MITELLSHGIENALTGREICAILGISIREVAKYVEMERRAGSPICAASGDAKGYYLASTQEEMQNYCGRLLHRAGELHKTRRACLKTMQNLPTEAADNG